MYIFTIFFKSLPFNQPRVYYVPLLSTYCQATDSCLPLYFSVLLKSGIYRVPTKKIREKKMNKDTLLTIKELYSMEGNRHTKNLNSMENKL